jgi:hypothetical protein
MQRKGIKENSPESTGSGPGLLKNPSIYFSECFTDLQHIPGLLLL